MPRPHSFCVRSGAVSSQLIQPPEFWGGPACVSCFCRYRVAVGLGTCGPSLPPLLAQPGPCSPDHALGSAMSQQFHCCGQTNPCFSKQPHLWPVPPPALSLPVPGDRAMHPLVLLSQRPPRAELQVEAHLLPNPPGSRLTCLGL